MAYAPFSCPYPPTPEEQATYEAEGRKVAEEKGPGIIFTDGLGVMGVGSWDDGPAHYRTRGYREALGPNA